MRESVHNEMCEIIGMVFPLEDRFIDSLKIG